MNKYTVKAINKNNRCVRRCDTWTVISARRIYQRLTRDFPSALVQIYGPDNKIVSPVKTSQPDHTQ